jgi:hypothetical protein
MPAPAHSGQTSWYARPKLAVILATKSEDNLAKMGRRVGEVKGPASPMSGFVTGTDCPAARGDH